MHSFQALKPDNAARGFAKPLTLQLALSGMLALSALIGLSRGTCAQSDALAGGVSFAGLAQTVTQQDYTIEQLRRFFSASGVVTTREEARVVANGSAAPDYELDYLGVEGEPAGSALWQQWQQTYTEHGRLFFEHGLFRVRDMAAASKNYSLHSFGNTTRAGRPARRVVIFPNQMDKAIWLLEVDIATQVLLFSAEYDSQLRLMSEVEAVTFTLGAQLSTTTSTSTTTVFSDLPAAQAFMGHPAGIIDPFGVTAEYSLSKVQVSVNPLNNRQTLLLGYTDGVDLFFVTQTPGAPDAFAALPVRQRPWPSHTIARYRDPSMSVLVFWDDGVSFQVAGRGALLRLDDFAESIYTKAIVGQ